MQVLIDLIKKGAKDNYQEWFESIANLLFGKYIIAAGNERYRFIELEFYYYCEKHKDETTYGFVDPKRALKDRIIRHKRAQLKTLSWFFHYSGVDIVMGKENEPGGILIRAIENVRTGEKIQGPLVVLLELLNQQIGVEGAVPFQLKIVSSDSELEYKIAKSKRVGLGDGAFKESLYNFSRG